MDNFFKFLVGDTVADGEQPQTTQSTVATADDKTKIAENVLSSASVGQLPPQTPPAAQAQSAVTTDVAAQTEITPPAVSQAAETVTASQPATPPVIDTSAMQKPEDAAAEEKKTSEASVSSAPEIADESIDYTVTDAAEDMLGKLGRKLQMKVYFTQAVASEFGETLPAAGTNVSLGTTGTTDQANPQPAKTLTQSQGELTDKLAALRDQLSAELKPAGSATVSQATQNPQQAPNPTAPSVA